MGDLQLQNLTLIRTLIQVSIRLYIDASDSIFFFSGLFA